MRGDPEAICLALEAGEAGAVAKAQSIGVGSFFSWRTAGREQQNGAAAPTSGGSARRATLLHVAAAMGLSRAAAALIQMGADANAASPDDGSSPLHAACLGRADGLPSVLGVLISAGGDKDQRDSLGRLPVDLLLQVSKTDGKKPQMTMEDSGMGWERRGE